ncbi:MAG: hypothetical protein WKG03_09340 [Telluria sp.]
MENKLSHLLEVARTIVRLPVAQLDFRREINPDDVIRMHRHFTKRHPRYLVFQNKSLGAALLDLSRFPNRDEYMTALHNNAAVVLARKARKKGYQVVEIDRNGYVDQIDEINNSLEMRQGRPMDPIYREKVTLFKNEKNFTYIGVLNPAGKLVSYGNLGLYGNFIAIDRLIGLRNNDGVMHMLVTEIVSRLIEQRKVRYLMYDTCFGANPGLLQFKTMLGFTPHRVNFTLQ